MYHVIGCLHRETDCHIYTSVNWAIIGSDNNLPRVGRQAIIGTCGGLLFIGPLGRNFSDILMKKLLC